MNEEMMKSLVNLIDESLAEIEELKKSDRFSASEITLGDSSSGVKDQDKNGSVGKEEDGAEKADKDSETEPGRQPQEEGDIEEDHDDEDKKKKKKDGAKKGDDEDDDYGRSDEVGKGEGKNAEADPNRGQHQPVAKEDTGMPSGTAGSSGSGSEGTNSEADPNRGHHKATGSMQKSEEEFQAELKKAREEATELAKSYVDEKFSALESKLEGIAKSVQELADSPVPARGATYKDVKPLQKSNEEEEPLNKSQVVDKLWELKKSGETVDTADITSVELGSPAELTKVAQKYNIK